MTRISSKFADVATCVLVLIASCLLLSEAAPSVHPAVLLREFGAMLTGTVPAKIDASLRNHSAMAVVALELPVAALIALLLQVFLGESTSHAGGDRFRHIRARTIGEALVRFLPALVLTLGIGALAGILEEPVFRWLFCGWISRPAVSYGGLFLFLALIGNIVFALVHLPNFRNRRERNLLRALPQFWTGLWMILMLAKFGLLGAIICHSLHNLVAMLAGIPDYLRKSLRSTY